MPLAIIAATNDVGRGKPVDLRKLKLGRFLREGGVVLANHQNDVSAVVGKCTAVEHTPDGLLANWSWLGNELARHTAGLFDAGLCHPSIGWSNGELREISMIPLPADPAVTRRSAWGDDPDDRARLTFAAEVVSERARAEMLIDLADTA